MFYSEDLEVIALTMPQDVAGLRLDAALARIIPELSRNKLTNWLKNGRILVNNHILKPKDKVIGNENVVINPELDDQNGDYLAENIPLNIVYEDQHIIIINKPKAMVVHPGNGNWCGTLLNALLFHCPKLKNIPRAGIVHRLDKDTTGLLVVAKTLTSQTSLVKQLQNRTVERRYRVIVEGHSFKEGIVNKNIGRNLHHRTKMAILASGKEAITHYTTLKHFTNFSYIECKLETGRTHQIRVHMKSINHPIVGDKTYGSCKTNYIDTIKNAIEVLARQALHAYKLTLIHPHTSQVISFEAPIPDDMNNLLQALYASS